MTLQEQIDSLVALNTDIADWEQRRDADAIADLDRLLSPALVFRRADGSLVGKDAFMSALHKPGPFVSRESRDVRPQVIGDRALVTLTVICTRADQSVSRYRNIRVFILRGDQWQLDVWFNDDVTCLPGLLGLI